MKAVSLGVVLVGSADPARLRAWYADAFGVRVDADGLLDFGTASVLIDQRDVAPRAAEPGRMILTFTVSDLDEAESRLIDREVVWIREVEQTSVGRIGTLVDPDGNYVQVLERSKRRVSA
jgi:predicted enzyme related to lactoylglutathione lyase